jgi:copper chaperone CopZ
MAAKTVTVHVPGLRCRQDVRAISAAVQDLDGVTALQADLIARRIVVHGDVSGDAVCRVVEAAGYDVNGRW